MTDLMKLTMTSVLGIALFLPAAQPAAAANAETARPQLVAQASEADREFARKLRELKQRQNDEWNELVSSHEAALRGAAALTAEEKRALAQQQLDEKKALQQRHDIELEALKADYPA